MPKREGLPKCLLGWEDLRMKGAGNRVMPSKRNYRNPVSFPFTSWSLCEKFCLPYHPAVMTQGNEACQSWTESSRSVG